MTSFKEIRYIPTPENLSNKNLFVGNHLYSQESRSQIAGETAEILHIVAPYFAQFVGEELKLAKQRFTQQLLQDILGESYKFLLGSNED